jgi:hypothetical protein
MNLNRSFILGCLIMAVSLCEMCFVKGSPFIRSHFNGRIKGESRGSTVRIHHRQLENDPRQAKYAGNLLSTFDRVVSLYHVDVNRCDKLNVPTLSFKSTASIVLKVVRCVIGKSNILNRNQMYQAKKE